MHIQLAKALLKTGLISKGMEIEAAYETSALGRVNTTSTSANFMIEDIIRNERGEIVFLIADTQDGTRRIVSMSQITKLDGMSPDRYAAVYNIAPDGSPKSVGNRRGRKPRNRNIKDGGYNPVQGLIE